MIKLLNNHKFLRTIKQIIDLFAWKWVVNYNELTPLFKMKNTEKEEIVGPSNVKSLVFEI